MENIKQPLQHKERRLLPVGDLGVPNVLEHLNHERDPLSNRAKGFRESARNARAVIS